MQSTFVHASFSQSAFCKIRMKWNYHIFEMHQFVYELTTILSWWIYYLPPIIETPKPLEKSIVVKHHLVQQISKFSIYCENFFAWIVIFFHFDQLDSLKKETRKNIKAAVGTRSCGFNTVWYMLCTCTYMCLCISLVLKIKVWSHSNFCTRITEFTMPKIQMALECCEKNITDF